MRGLRKWFFFWLWHTTNKKQEKHFPHSVANAVVNEAKRRYINHAEKHAKVEYVVAHGIASSIL
jgi:hypothetical protein